VIAKAEGWSVTGSLTHKLHNPGALTFVNQVGARRDKSGYARFETDVDGLLALGEDLKRKLGKGWSQEKVLRNWSVKPREYLKLIRRLEK